MVGSWTTFTTMASVCFLSARRNDHLHHPTTLPEDTRQAALRQQGDGRLSRVSRPALAAASGEPQLIAPAAVMQDLELPTLLELPECVFAGSDTRVEGA